MPQKKQSTLRVVDSLAEITRHHDRSILEKSMLKTVDDLFPGGKLRLYRVEEVESKPCAILLTYYENGFIDGSIQTINTSETFLSALEDVIDTGEVVSIACANEPDIYDNIYPAFDAQNDIFATLVHSGERPTYNQQRLVHGILKVYANYLSLLDKTERDKLTGLFNRETLDEELTKSLISNQLKNTTSTSLRKVSSGRPPASLAYIGLLDIDHFKSINDNFGHLYGDEILVLIARFLKESFTRKEDLVYRYGGEEFVILIGSNSDQEAFAAFDRIRSEIQKQGFPQIDKVTVSIGIAAIKDQNTPADIIGQADKALYFAKNNGRNQVCDYHDLVAEGKIVEVKSIEHDDAELF